VSGHQGLRRSKETKTKKQKKDMKMRKQIALGAMLLTVGLFGSSSTIVAQTDPGTAWNEQYRTEYEVHRSFTLYARGRTDGSSAGPGPGSDSGSGPRAGSGPRTEGRLQ